jgi:hypothetical protein
MARKLSKDQKRKKKLQDRSRKDRALDVIIDKKMKAERELAKRKIAWINENGHTKLPQDFE